MEQLLILVKAKDIYNSFSFSWPFSFVVLFSFIWLSSGLAQSSSPDGDLQNYLVLGVIRLFKLCNLPQNNTDNGFQMRLDLVLLPRVFL